jgi:hypothetical protein
MFLIKTKNKGKIMSKANIKTENNYSNDNPEVAITKKVTTETITTKTVTHYSDGSMETVTTEKVHPEKVKHFLNTQVEKVTSPKVISIVGPKQDVSDTKPDLKIVSDHSDKNLKRTSIGDKSYSRPEGLTKEALERFQRKGGVIQKLAPARKRSTADNGSTKFSGLNPGRIRSLYVHCKA